MLDEEERARKRHKEQKDEVEKSLRNLRNQERYMEKMTARVQRQSRELDQRRQEIMAEEPEIEDGGVRKRPHPFPQGNKKHGSREEKQVMGTWEPSSRTAARSPR